MKILTFICIISLGLGSQINGQTMVGLSKPAVVAAVKKNHKGFKKDDSVIKQHFNYLKFVNRPKTKTWIIYFNDQDVCKTSKMVCDYLYLNEVEEDLNSRYTRTGEDLWEFQADSATIQVELIRLDWYFSIRETRKTIQE